MNEIATLKPKIVGTIGQPVEGIVKMLERLLDEAQKGQLRGLAVACVYAMDGKPDGGTNSGFVLGPFTTYGMAYALRELHWKFDDEQFIKGRAT